MYRSEDQIRADLRRVAVRVQNHEVELGNLEARIAAEGDEDGGRAQRVSRVESAIANLQAERQGYERELVELAERREAVRAAALDPRNLESGDGAEGGGTHRRVTRDNSPAAQARDEALRAIDRADMSARAKDHAEEVSRRDPVEATYIARHLNPDFDTAFGKWVTGRSQYEFTPREAEAFRNAAESHRAMSVGTGSAGGYGVPLTIDPTINITGDGALNPLRSLATVKTITTSEWKGVSSAGVTAAFAAEGTEASDNTPTLAQPDIIPERAQVFVPFSWEVSQDWGTLQAELVKLFQDAKNVLEASKFTTGAGHGSHEPQGIITGATGTVAAGSASFAVANLYTIQESLKPRYQPRASWLSSLTIKNAARRLVASADPDEPQLFNPDGTELLGKPWFECSDMATSQTNGSKIFVYGDIADGFCIVDRIGFSVSLIPHLFGASGRPTGQSGLYGFWRTSSGVTNVNALKVLQTTAS